MECDFSSIEMHSKVDLMLESRVKTVTAESEFSEPEELYGLTDLKKKYNDQKNDKRQSNQKQQESIRAQEKPHRRHSPQEIVLFRCTYPKVARQMVSRRFIEAVTCCSGPTLKQRKGFILSEL